MSAALSGAPDERPATAANEGTARLRELLVVGQETTRGMLEAEEALHRVRQRFEQAEGADRQGELAAEALDHVERQLQLTRERRRLLDGVEGTLWSRRNRLERILIQARGAAWWQARRNRPADEHPDEHREDGAAWSAWS
jgi:hypothetical protein